MNINLKLLQPLYTGNKINRYFKNLTVIYTEDNQAFQKNRTNNS